MKKELALIIGAILIIFAIYPLTWYLHLDYRGIMLLVLPLIFITLYSMYHAMTLLFKGERKKAIIFVTIFVGAIIVSFQFTLLMIRLTIPFTV